MDNVTELFDNFEINSVPRWPVLSRLVAGSFALHLLFVLLVIYVPGVRSALNIANMFSGVEYVDEDYTKTEVGERAEVIDLAPEKFQYPEGYFSQGETAIDQLAPEIINETQAAPPPPPPPPSLPTPTPTPTPTPAPSPQASPSAQPTQSPAVASSTGSTAANSQPVSEEERDKTLDKIAGEAGVKRPPRINPKPFKVLLAKGKEMKDKGEIDLNGTVELTVEGDRNADGTLSNVEITGGKASDVALKELAKEFIAALSDSHALAFIDGAGHLIMKIKSDPQGINVVIETEMASEAVASSNSQGYSLLLYGARAKAEADSDEEKILKSTHISSSGKQLIVKFEMPRATVEEMLKKQMSKPRAEG
ncbi:MAG TPA: hypothetical protein VF708_21240 [Pyrinomonadaceae bacterium]